MQDGTLTHRAENQGATKPVAVIIIGADGLLAARPATPIQLWHGCLALGYDLAVPATWGDELVAAECLRALGSHPTPVALMCSCPLVARAVSRVEPDVTPHLVSIVAPPVATARYVRRVHGDRRVHITYAGACPSAGDSAIDAWITPAELMDRFASAEVVLSEQPELFESVLPPDRRRHLSQPGGLPTSERAATIPRPRLVHEIEDDDVLGELTRQLAGDVRTLLDIAPRVGCVCSGAMAEVPASESRAAVMQLEPPRSTRPVMADPGGLGLKRRLPVQPWILRDRSLPLPPPPPQPRPQRSNGEPGGTVAPSTGAMSGSSPAARRPTGGNGHGVATAEIDEVTVAAARALEAASLARAWSGAATRELDAPDEHPLLTTAPLDAAVQTIPPSLADVDDRMHPYAPPEATDFASSTPSTPSPDPTATPTISTAPSARRHIATAPTATAPGATGPGATGPSATTPGATAPSATAPAPFAPGPTAPGPTTPIATHTTGTYVTAGVDSARTSPDPDQAATPVAPSPVTAEHPTPVGNYWFVTATSDAGARPVEVSSRVAAAAPALARVARKLADTDYRGELAAASTAVASTVRRTADRIGPPLEARMGELRRATQRPGHGIIATVVVLLLLIVTLLVAADMGEDRAASSGSPDDPTSGPPSDPPPGTGGGQASATARSGADNGRGIGSASGDTAAGWSRAGGPTPRRAIGAPLTPQPVETSQPVQRRARGNLPAVDSTATGRSSTGRPPTVPPPADSSAGARSAALRADSTVGVGRDSLAIRDSIARAAEGARQRELAAIQAELLRRQERLDSIARANGLPVPPRTAPPGGAPPPSVNPRPVIPPPPPPPLTFASGGESALAAS